MAGRSGVTGKKKRASTRTAVSTAKKRRTAPTAKSPLKSGVGTSRFLMPPKGGAAIRMYRIGHGDCFLLAFPGKDEERPVFVLVDCGYKPGSPGMLEAPTKAKDIAADILATTGGTIDVVVVTHEHQDHLNGFTRSNFPGLRIGQVWFAWTESKNDEVANKLRRKFNDRLLHLIDIRQNLAAEGSDLLGKIDDLLELELGEPANEFSGHKTLGVEGKDAEGSSNKKAMKFLQECSKADAEYLYPHEKPRVVAGAKSVRAFVLGPPRDPEKIDDLDPEGDERFFDGMGVEEAGSGAASGSPAAAPWKLFSGRHTIPLEDVLNCSDGDFFNTNYGFAPVPTAADGEEAPSNAEWRRLTANDAADTATLALAMNNATNNSSLVLAFELTPGGKVLLFAADAQAGNWRSWADNTFDDGRKQLSVADLLSRTVVYKVGHHGSHNATLKGVPGTQKPSLHAMAMGTYGHEFVAMITAVENWAHKKPKPDWDHPLPAIKSALIDKAEGRVLQTDTAISEKAPARGARNWKDFMRRVKETQLYFDLIIEP